MPTGWCAIGTTLAALSALALPCAAFADPPQNDEASSDAPSSDATSNDAGPAASGAKAHAAGAPAKKTPAPAPIRPPPYPRDIDTPPPTTTTRHVEVGFSLLAISRPAADVVPSGAPAYIKYAPTLGLQASLRIPIHRYFHIGAFVTGGRHHIDYEKGALGVHGSIDGSPLTTIWFGLKAMPTWPITERVRLFGIAGFAWGRLELPPMTAHEPGHEPFAIDDRGSSFVSFPIGVGTSIEVVKNWLTVDFELDVSPNVHKDGTMFVGVQAIDGGSERQIGPFPKDRVIYTQSLGVSLIL
jgi:opacity protein-like surface antigen